MCDENFDSKIFEFVFEEKSQAKIFEFEETTIPKSQI